MSFASVKFTEVSSYPEKLTPDNSLAEKSIVARPLLW